MREFSFSFFAVCTASRDAKVNSVMLVIKLLQPGMTFPGRDISSRDIRVYRNGLTGYWPSREFGIYVGGK